MPSSARVPPHHTAAIPTARCRHRANAEYKTSTLCAHIHNGRPFPGAAGVSSLLFNNDRASANTLLLSIKADQSITYGIVKSIQDAINRIVQAQSYGKNFHVNFLDVSPFNRKEVGEAYLKAASYGLPTISAYAASQGIGQAELDGMSYLETTVLGLQDMFRPIVSSTQVSAEDLESEAATDEGGAPRKDIGEITESGEANREAE